MANTIQANMDELNELIRNCNNIAYSLFNIEKDASKAFSALLDAYQGEATPIIKDALPKVKEHISMLLECYNILCSFAAYAKQELEEQDAATAKVISDSSSN